MSDVFVLGRSLHVILVGVVRLDDFILPALSLLDASWLVVVFFTIALLSEFGDRGHAMGMRCKPAVCCSNVSVTQSYRDQASCGKGFDEP